MGSRTVTANFTPTDTNLAPSEASKTITVVRADDHDRDRGLP